MEMSQDKVKQGCHVCLFVKLVFGRLFQLLNSKKLRFGLGRATGQVLVDEKLGPPDLVILKFANSK